MRLAEAISYVSNYTHTIADGIYRDVLFISMQYGTVVKRDISPIPSLKYFRL
jgi:hypothetical protein